MSRMAIVAVSVCLGSLPALLVAAPPPSATQPSNAPVPAEQAEAWVRNLDSDDYAVRETATRALIDAGPDAIEALARGVVSDSPEMAWRASEALQQIALDGDETALARAAAAMDGASRAGKAGMATIVRDLRLRQQQLRHDRAAAKLRALGAKLPEPVEPPETIWLGGGIVGAPIAVDFGGDVVVEVIADAGDLGPGRPVLEIDAGEPAVEAPDKPLPLKALEATLDRLDALTEPAEEGLDLPDTTVPTAADIAIAPQDAEATIPEPEAPEPAVAESPAAEPDAPAVADLPVADLPVADLPVADLPAAEPPPPPDDIPIRIEDEPRVELAPEALVADAVFIGDAFGSEVSDDAASGLTDSLVLDADWKGGDDGLAVLREIPSLVQVSIDNAPLTDDALPHLVALPKLAELRIKNTKLSAAALFKLRSQHKPLQVIAHGQAMLGVHAERTGPCILTGVYHGSGAEAAGLQMGDEIVAIDGHAIKDFSDLTIAVYPHAPGDKLQVEVRRDGQKRELAVVLKSRTDIGR